MLQVRLLGQFDVRVDSQPAVIPSRAGQSLLAYLMVTAGTPHRREKLAGLFWPDVTDENARTRLRHELWRVRKALSAAPAAADFIVADELTITFNPEAEYGLDVAQLEQELPANDSLDERVRQAGLYHGELLPGFYDEWIVLERARVQAVFERRMQQLLECLIAESRWKMTLEWSERWLAFGEMPEPAFRAMMLAYSALGDRSKVAATYDRCVAMLAQELDVAPSEETATLRDQLLRGEGVTRVDLSATHVAAAQNRSFTEPPTPGEPPFKGLQAFEEADADRFFGRELLTAKLIGRLRESRFLAVIVGASGSGKSSIVRAGLIPQLKRGELLADGTLPPAGSAHWQVHVITPTAHPLEALAVSLTRGTESVTAATTLAEDLARDARSLRLFVRRSLEASSSAQHLLLVVDQFEELFTLCRSEFEREAFVDNLIAALEPDTGGGLTLVLTLRADFYAHLASYPELRDAVARQQEYIGPMSAEELRRAIEEPARRGGWDFQPGLVDVLLRDVGDEPGALPLLSHALLETWQRRSGRTLTLQGYAETGGVRGAIAHTAETVYQALSPEQQPLARHIFLRLTELGEGTEDTRRRASLQELMAQSDQAGEVRAVLNILAQARLITLSEVTAEVAHEALIRAWPTLREWLNADREGLLLHRHLTEAAYDWELLERDPGALYRGARLAQAAEWAAANPDALNILEQAFLAASREQEQHEAVEREVQRQRELEQARHLAETERARADSEQLRAEEQRRSASRLRTRNRVIAVAGALVTVVAIIAIIFGRQATVNATRADQSAAQALANAATAQAASGLADQQRAAAVNAQATAQADFTRAEAQRLAAEANVLLKSNGSSELSALLVLRSMNLQYSPQGDAALLSAVNLNYPRQIFRGHTDWVMSTVFSPDGKYVLTGGLDKTVRLWDAQSGTELRQFVHPDIVQTVAFSPDGKYILTGGLDETARLWDAQTGTELRQFVHPDHLGSTVIMASVSFSTDGKLIFTGCLDKTVREWDVQTGQELRHWVLGAPISFVTNDGRYALTFSDTDGTMQLWDVETATALHTLTNPQGGWGTYISPNEKYVFTGDSNGTAHLWDVKSGREVQTFKGHSGGVSGVAFSPDGQYMLTGSPDKTARLWDIQTGQEIRRFIGHTHIIHALAFSPDGQYVLTGSHDGTARLWEVQPRTELPVFTGHPDVIAAVAFSPDGKDLATADVDNTMRLWDATTGQTLRIITGTGSVNYGLKFSPDGKYILTGNMAGVARLWDSQTGQVVRQFTTNGLNSINAVAFSPDGQYILAGGKNDTGAPPFVPMWETQTGKEILRFTSPVTTDEVYTVNFSPDGKYILTGGLDTIARLWDAGTGKVIREFVGHADVVTGGAFSPDGKYVVTASTDKTARLWDVQTGREIRRFIGHVALLWSVAYSPDGKTIATASADDTARLWDAATGQELRRYVGHTAAVENVAFSPDGKYLISVSDDTTARLWDVDYHTAMQYLCSRLLRDFTDEERAQYNINDKAPTCPRP